MSPLKGVIRDIRRWHTPTPRSIPTDEQETEFATDHPAMVREAFAAHLLGTPAFAHGVDQLDAVGVNDAEHRRSGQEDPRPSRDGSGRGERAACARGAGKQRAIVSGQPPVKRAVAHAFERMQQPQGDDLTGPEVGLGVFGDGAQLLIDLIEQRGDKIYVIQLSSPGKDITPTSVEESSDDCKPKNLYRSLYSSIIIH